MVKILNILLLFFSSLPLRAGMVVTDIDKVALNKEKCVISGKLVSDDNKPVDFATVSLEGTSYGCVSDLNGFFVLNAPVGQYTLVVSAMGYKTVKQRVTVEKGVAATVNLVIPEEALMLEELTVTASSVERVKKTPFNAVAVDAKEWANSTKNLSDAL